MSLCRTKIPHNSLYEIFNSDRILFMDGGTGTMLQKMGMPAGVNPEEFVLSNPEILRSIHQSYVFAGSDIITTCTFGANIFKLPSSLDVFETNKTLASLARESVREADSSRKILIAGDVGPCGLFAKPLGDVEPDQLIKTFKDQIRGLAAGGADIILLETQYDLAEARAAVVAARETCDLPLIVSMTFENGISLTGSTPEIFAETMLNMGVDIIGSNCGTGPDELLPVIRSIISTGAKLVIAQPNAGIPILRDGKTYFPLSPNDFAEKTALFAKFGTRVLGGCCGTTPECISLLKNIALNIEPIAEINSQHKGICLTSRSQITRIGANEPFVIIGERINPTGKPTLVSAFQKNDLSLAYRFADEQIASGASVLDINVGAPLVEEEKLLPHLICSLSGRYSIPLSLDSSNNTAIAKALPYYPGSCLVNSISGEKDRMALLGSLCRNYGSPFILLPLQGSKLPKKAIERISIVEKLLEQARDLNIPDRLVLIDLLALSVSSIPDGGKQCLEMARWCQKHDFASTIGLSNISFGLPARELLNSVFLSMANGAGLTSCIANPCNTRIQESLDAINLLNGEEDHAIRFTNKYAQWKTGTPQIISSNENKNELTTTARDAVLNGDKENIVSLLKEEMKKGTAPFDIVNDILIPAITEVGSRYERKEYFLPQLIRSAETMQKAFEFLKPSLEKTKSIDKKPVVVLATVEGDIHDIGKNIVALLLGNHGFRVIDAGKDVPAEKIIKIALENNAKIIGLSALMTTTMTRMTDTINIIKERKLPIKVMVGGAALTQEFADHIGADAYCEDAVSSVKVAQSFVQNLKK